MIDTDVLETIIGSSPVTKKHDALLSAVAEKTFLREIAFVTKRNDFMPMPRRILDRDGNLVAKNFKEWMRDRLEQQRGDYLAVWQTYKDAGYVMTECVPVMLYLVHDRGGDQTNFVQLKIFEEHEFVSRDLFNPASSGRPFSIDSMLDGREAGEEIERHEIGNGWYRLLSAVDMGEFVPEAERLYEEERELRGKQVLGISSSNRDEVTHTTFAQLCPELCKYPWKGTRLFQDWAASSAGQSGARICRHWVFDTYDYQSEPNSKREMSFIPQWGFNRPLAKITRPGKNVYELFGKLQKLDQRVGIPFAWYFYMLHGNRVEDWAGQRVLRAVEQGLIVLPEPDYRVLKRWEDQPYGF
jgi:hypothetical protein